MNSLSQDSPAFFIDSATLNEIRKFLELRPSIQRLVGLPIQFKVVMDANIAIADVLRKARMPHLPQTAIEECVRAGSLLVYAPRWLDTEMTTSAIPQAALKKRIDLDFLVSLWSEYKEIILWDDVPVSCDQQAMSDGDAKDVPYIALEKRIDAVGILSRDKDIVRMGGNALQLEFVFGVQRYSRAASVHLTIYLSGSLIGVMSFGALQCIVRGLIDLVVMLPPWARYLLLASVIGAVLHPESRRAIIEQIGRVVKLGESAAPHLLNLINTAGEKQREAEVALVAAQVLSGRGAAS